MGNTIPIDRFEIILIHLRIHLWDLVLKNMKQPFIVACVLISGVVGSSCQLLEYLLLNAWLNFRKQITDHKLIMTLLAIKIKTAIYIIWIKFLKNVRSITYEYTMSFSPVYWPLSYWSCSVLIGFRSFIGTCKHYAGCCIIV